MPRPGLRGLSPSYPAAVSSALSGVVIEVVRPLAGESGAETGQVRFRRFESSGPQLTISFTVSGTAESGDYNLSTTTAIIPADESVSNSIDVTGREDADLENEYIDVTVQNGGNYLWSDPKTGRIDIGDNDTGLPLVTIAASPNPGSETGPVAGRFTISRTPVGPAPLVVHFALSPSSRAKEVSDFNALSRELRIPPNVPTADIVVIPRDDGCFEGPEPVGVDLMPGVSYSIGSANSATLTINDNDPGPDIVSITAPDPDASERGPENGRFTVSRCNANSALTVTFSVSDPATNGTDYESIGNSVTIPAGSFSQDITVRPYDNDSEVEGDEPVTVTLTDTSADYDLGQPSAATVTIHDNDCTSGSGARLQSLRPNLNPPITFTGQPVTFTARLRPSNPPPGHGAFYWQARELLGRDAQGLHWGDWLPAPGTRTNNTLVTTQYTPWTGQYHVELVPCWSFFDPMERVASVAFQARPTVNMTAYRPQTKFFKWRTHPVPNFDYEEEIIGAGIRLNGDSDDGDLLPDRYDPSVPNEDDLILLELQPSPSSPPRGVRYVLRRTNTSISVWMSNTKGQSVFQGNATEQWWSNSAPPREVWVESTRHDVTFLEFMAVDASTNRILDSDRIRFFSFLSVVIALGGEDQDPIDPPPVPTLGTFRIAVDLYDRAYDVHMYNEDVVDVSEGTGNVGAGEAFNEVESAVQRRGVAEIAVFGYSHGGGATRDLADGINSRLLGPGVIMPFTGYIDAVENTHWSTRACETRRPPGSLYHANFYQTVGSGDALGLVGCPVPTANYEIWVTPRPWGAGLLHYTIDDSVNVRIGSSLEPGMLRELMDQTNR